jgi:hypothetical protein
LPLKYLVSSSHGKSRDVVDVDDHSDDDDDDVYSLYNGSVKNSK